MKDSSKRPDWDHYWFVQAVMYSTRGTCDRLRVACVIVNDKRLVGAGYNGSTRGAPHCDDVGHLMIENHCERTIHGELNAVLNSERKDLIGATAYVTAAPCIRCAKTLVNSGVSHIKYLDTYKNSRGKEYLAQLANESGVTIELVDLDPRNLIQEAVDRLESKGGILFTSE